MAISLISGKPHCCTPLYFHVQLAADVLGDICSLHISIPETPKLQELADFGSFLQAAGRRALQ